MSYGNPGSCRYQNYNRTSLTDSQAIENLKNRLADNRLSPYQFYSIFYAKFRRGGFYRDFLKLINFEVKVNAELAKAILDFGEVSI